MSIKVVERKILEKNDIVAQSNRKAFEEKNIFAINMLSSPGSGKTSLIERMIEFLRNKIRIAVIEGDLQTKLDAERIEKYGVPVTQIITNGACHLDAILVKEAFLKLCDYDFDILIIENVGNLVCPAGFDLGENIKVIILSTTEGDDKPLKYPLAFLKSSALVINKIDLLPYINSSIEVIKNNALSINPRLKIFETSCTENIGVENLCEWILNIKSENKVQN
ncbi:hydrogenase nickel incorporation protein HypB [Rosettibacter firmus]|uniref:hydrogenase nickel incorporation protein HypB n=1 Tax=Rosettibacter firmus TaxID=3111522 RepID=UPI00336BB033